MKDLRNDFTKVKFSSDFTINKLEQVETSMDDMNLAEKLREIETKSETPSQNDESKENEESGHVSKPSKGRGKDNIAPRVLIITDMDMSKDHIKYTQDKLGLGCYASVG